MTHAEDQLPDELLELSGALQRADFNAARQYTAHLSRTQHLDDVLAVLIRYAQQQPQALELLLEALDEAGTVRRFAGASLLDQNAVDDVSQDAMISIADSLDSYNGRGKVTTWVHTIVQRRVVDHLRRQRATVPLDQHDISPTARMSSIIATRATVHDALDALPELYRQPVVLRDIAGHAYADIAQRLDRPEGTVKAQIARGRAMIAAQLRGTGAAG